MATINQRITNCLWFDSEAEEAAKLYTSIFKNSSIGAITRFGKEGFEFHGKKVAKKVRCGWLTDKFGVSWQVVNQ